MLSPKFLALAALGLLVVAGGSTAVVLAVTDFGTVEAPEWRPGYTFSHATSVEGLVKWDISFDGEGLYGEEPLEVDPTREVFETFFLDEFQGDTMFVGAMTSILDGSQWSQPWAFRQRDLAPTWVDVGDGEVYFEEEVPFTFIDFPLQRGKDWTVLDEEVDEDLDVNVKLRAEAKRMVSVDTPVGKTDAVQIDYWLDKSSIKDAIRDAKAEAEEFGVHFTKDKLDFDYTASLYYSPEFLHVAKGIADIRIDVDLAGTVKDPGSGEKYPFKVKATLDYRADIVIDGLRLVERPARTVDDLLVAWNGDLPLLDPAGQSPADTSFAFNLVVPGRSVNVADDEALGVTIEPVGDAPSGVTYQYQLLDSLNRVLEGPAAQEFALYLPDAGAYTLIVEARDASGRALAIQSVPVYGDFIGTVDAACDPMEAVSGSCDAIALAIHPGIRSLSIQGSVDRPEVEPVMSLVGPNGVQDTASPGSLGAAASIDVDDFRHWMLGKDGWAVTWDHTASANDAVHYDLQVLYTPSVSAQPVQATGGLRLLDMLLPHLGGIDGVQLPGGQDLSVVLPDLSGLPLF